MEASLVVRLFMTQTFEFASDLWCIGQLASDPWGQVHSARPPRSVDTTKAIGTSISVAAWQKSQAIAMRPRARRVRVMDVYVSAVRRLCQMRRATTVMRRRPFDGEECFLVTYVDARDASRVQVRIATSTLCAAPDLSRPQPFSYQPPFTV
jgi:hypothetical protein